MSKFGLKIKNYEAGSLYGHELGVRDSLDSTDAMLTNSLFSDYLISIGLNVWKEESTRDVICLDFNYGTRSYAEEIKTLNKKVTDCIEECKKGRITEEEKDLRCDRLYPLLAQAAENKDKFKKVSKEDIRTHYYINGVTIQYQTHNKKGEVIKEEDIHYKMLYRTPGKAKKGSCMFINEKLYDKAIDFLRMGIKLPEKNSPIVEIGAYSSLITSTIVGKVEIRPEEILVIKDIDSYFETNVISIEIDEEKQCKAVAIDDYKLKNTLFDGQALIDTSIFPDWGDGYILLRHHMFKAAAFHSNIQMFMQEYYGDQYDTATVTDMFGNEVLVKNIKMITTENAMKWLKFGVDFDYWGKKVRENGCQFGIVKTAHKSKLGEVQRMSYQMINALDMKIMPQVTQCSLDYINLLKTDDEVFLDYLEKNKNFSNDFEVLIALVKHNPEFVRCEYFRDRKRKIIEAYTLNFKTGKIIQEADNLVIVGSPYAMLLHAVGEDYRKDDTFSQEEDAIQCYTERFEFGEHLAEFRNPFNSKNNLGYMHNVYDERLSRYFNFGKQIVAVNMIGTSFQDKNNGSDQDSDTIYTTNQPEIAEYAKYCYKHYPTIVNNIPQEKNSYDCSLENFAKIDNKLAAAQLAIGESSNLAQICLTYTYNYPDQKYSDYVCMLSVLA